MKQKKYFHYLLKRLHKVIKRFLNLHPWPLILVFTQITFGQPIFQLSIYPMTELSTSYPRSYFRKSRVSVLKSNLHKDRLLLKLHPLRKIHVLMLLGWHIQHLHCGTSSKLQISWACNVSLQLYNNFQKVNLIPKYTIHSSRRFLFIHKQMDTTWQTHHSLQHIEVHT